VRHAATVTGLPITSVYQVVADTVTAVFSGDSHYAPTTFSGVRP
jgi:hypothetical protein